MTPDPDPPARNSAHHATVPLTKETEEPREPTALGPPEHDAPLPNLTAGERGRGHRTHRPWSARRLPAALVASVILVAAAAALFDVVAVRAGHPAAAWRRHLADELATRPLDDVWVLTGAAVAAALGIWLIVLSLTPGLRHWLPLRSPAPGLRASLDRDGAADLLRDAAIRVPGVSTARVRVRRHRIKARADVRFRDPQQVKDDLTTVLDEERDQLALARPPRIVVRVRRRTH
ncbi:alkaline shock response membrane anchor protein AmaP [Streptomyces mirabilis]|uniref:alkaline shock response membrane anchor protein AmaP n=1 Tax=Streptomyces mirabilis TaxID=68239 RepID=UPI0021BEF0AE|nr:alkaline shock response membrane anchor protein AmaP [Streptomyces mirabilis]MCT9114033.1 alkaline shock response membrane anchor protein AmaP [Streptomyces mirabilis]